MSPPSERPSCLDHRPNDGLHARGAEAIDYEALNLNGPKNAPFEAVDELRQVLGMTPEVHEAVRSLVTVYSSGTDVDVTVAPEGVLRALSNLDPQRVQDILAARASGALLSRPQVVTVLSEGRSLGGGKFTREAVLRRSTIPTRLFDILVWRRRWAIAGATS